MRKETNTAGNIPLAIGSAIVLLGVSSVLAFLGRPTEMGLAILGGAIGLAFANIDRIQRFEGAGFKAEMREQVQAMLEKETEPTPEAAPSSALAMVDEEQQLVLRALGDPKYTWRFLGGIAAETKIPKDTVTTILAEFVKLGVARRSTGPNGPIWSLTVLGRKTLAVLSDGDSNA